MNEITEVITDATLSKATSFNPIQRVYDRCELSVYLFKKKADQGKWLVFNLLGYELYRYALEKNKTAEMDRKIIESAKEWDRLYDELERCTEYADFKWLFFNLRGYELYHYALKKNKTAEMDKQIIESAKGWDRCFNKLGR